jgi:hypothetical protein
MLQEGFEKFQSAPACCRRVLKSFNQSLHVEEGFEKFQSVPACYRRVLKNFNQSLQTACRGFLAFSH